MIEKVEREVRESGGQANSMVMEKEVILLTSHGGIWEAEVRQLSYSGPHSETQVKERKEGEKRGEGRGRRRREGRGRRGRGRNILVRAYGEFEEVKAGEDEQVIKPYIINIIETVFSLEVPFSFL